ncbi:cupin domain-containing protein [Polymorphospora rubra]|uniref:ChrR-like cupin domain-containing protein n=1 Tax=Polymorphospora rubra TaxID=338584 RepID=A0A810NBB6_9ACTN|nr:hypothetical protein [Polymorphospora rubra]BCJ69128.1 hypothetical protein Prubr_61490 [Polymorphospora rubra]
MTTVTAPTDTLDTTQFDWIPLGNGVAFKPLAFGPGDVRQLLLRVEPGTVVSRHRHTGDVHAFNIDSWMAVGDEPCVIHIRVSGELQNLADDGTVVGSTDTASMHRRYLAWCESTGTSPHPLLKDHPQQR